MLIKDQSVPQCSLPASSLRNFSRDSINAVTGHSISFLKETSLNRIVISYRNFSQKAEAAGREPDARGQQRFI